MHTEPGLAIGIDIGGTKTALALVSADGTILQGAVLATEAEQGFARAVDRMSSSIEQLLGSIEEGRSIAGIGIGCAGPVDAQRGLINNPYTLTGWNQCDIVSPLSQRFNVPAFLENDADVAALGECRWGAGHEADPVVMLTLGTGIGGAAVIGDRIYRGVKGEHPELGHIPIEPGGPKCYCGLSGCLESVASGTAIGSAGQNAGFEDARAVFAAAGNNTAARAIVERAVQSVALAAWTFCHTFLPQRLVLGGGMMEEHFDRFAPAIKERLQSATQFTPSAVEVVRAKLGNDAGVVGAACVALQATR
jgi:glucokinase